MTETLRLGLPLIAAGQSQKHVTVNESLTIIDDLAQLSVLDDHRSVPPAAPADGDRHIVGALASGAWAEADMSIAVWQDGAWRFYAPQPGWVAMVRSLNHQVCFDGSAWVVVAAALLETMAALGVGTAADAGNPLSVRADNVLFAARASADGGGDMRLKINKEAEGDTASHLFQSGWSGRAEFGLIGDNDFVLKVSPDGATWREAMRVDAGSGAVGFPQQGAAVPFSHGGCRLVLDGAALRLLPHNGGGLLVEGVLRAVPTGGVALASTGLAVNTTWFIYACWVSGAMALEADATAPARSAGTGVMLKSDDASRTLVGMARTVTGPAWVDAAAQRFVRSWFHREAVTLMGALAADVTVAAGGLATIDSAVSLACLAWADEAVAVSTSGSASAGGATSARLAITINAAVAAQLAASLTSGAVWAPALGVHAPVASNGLVTIACAAEAPSAGIIWSGVDAAATARLRLSARIGQ